MPDSEKEDGDIFMVIVEDFEILQSLLNVFPIELRLLDK